MSSRSPIQIDNLTKAYGPTAAVSGLNLAIRPHQITAFLGVNGVLNQALLFTGKVVMLTGVTLAVGVATWAFSPIKFQADMGILLAFMFLLNMLGALVLLPALAHFLLPAAPTEHSITTIGKPA